MNVVKSLFVVAPSQYAKDRIRSLFLCMFFSVFSSFALRALDSLNAGLPIQMARELFQRK